MAKIIFPPRPKSRMLPSELPYYESTGEWVAQRKFRGSRCVIYINKDRSVTIGSRHGKQFSKFTLTEEMKEQILGSLHLESGKAYWLDGELMNKDVEATNEVVLFDVLQAGRYLFGFPDQMRRLEILRDICCAPTKLCRSGLALEVAPKLWMAQTFDHDFQTRFKEAFDVDQLEGLVLRKKSASLDGFGDKEYETNNLIRCRKPFAQDKGYRF